MVSSSSTSTIRAKALSARNWLEELDLSVVDSRQAFFEGRDANNPTEAVTFTRGFRPPTRLPGSPVVPIAAHPTKNAANDNLIPSGGGSTSTKSTATSL